MSRFTVAKLRLSDGAYRRCVPAACELALVSANSEVAADLDVGDDLLGFMLMIREFT